MIGYVILSKRGNAEDGFDYEPVSAVFTDPVEIEYVRAGFDSSIVEFVIGEISVS